MTLQDRLPPGKYRLRVDDYERLANADAFGGQKTELIEGDVVVMSPQFRPHGMVKLELYDELLIKLRALKSPLRPVVEFSVALTDHTMVDPDIALTSEPRGPKAVPLASVALIIEVSDTTLADDLRTKQYLYASVGIPEFWVADVNSRIIRQFWSPSDAAYAKERTLVFGKPVSAVTVPDLILDTTKL